MIRFFIVLYYDGFQIINLKSVKKEQVCSWFNIQNAPSESVIFIRATGVRNNQWIASLFSEIIVLYSINLCL